jgi:tripartite-type tricarboxylate transporter receptor subunit TctC
MNKKIFISSLLALSLALPVAAQELWPPEELELVTHSSSGGGGDIMIRNMGRTLEEKFDINVVYNNRVGGSGAVALSWLANQAPTDGSSVMSVTPTQLITPLRVEGIPTYQDVTPIARLMIDPSVLAIHGESRFDSIEAFIDYARENPNELTVGIGSAGSLDQLVVQNFMTAADIELRIVPHEGGGDAEAALLGQHIDAIIGEPGGILSHLDSGHMRILTVFQEERLEAYPDVPTLQETGYDVVSNKFRGVFGPPGMEPELVEAIGTTLRDLRDDEPWNTYWREGSMTPAYLGHEEFVTFLDKANDELRTFIESLDD